MRVSTWIRPGLGRVKITWTSALACALALPGAAFALPDHMADSALVETLNSGSARDRAEACDRLGDRRLSSARDRIAQLAEKDGSARVRKACVEALGDLGGAESAAVLGRVAASDADAEVREEALEALEKVGTEATDAPIVARILKSDRSPRVREEAAELLGERRWKAGVPALAEVVRDSRAPIELRKACVEALFDMDDPAAHQVVYEVLLSSDSARLRREAADAIEERPPASALKPLCQALGDRDREVVEDAIEGLMKLGGPAAADCLRQAAGARNDGLARRMNEAANRLAR